MADRRGLRTLSQTFTFPGATAEEVAHVLATAPLVGDSSIFGARTTESTSTDGAVRSVIGFEPVPIPLLRFDVTMTQQRADDGATIVLEFRQPSRRRPYLAGQFVWLIGDGDGDSGAVLQEEINTPAALDLVDEPLHGTPFSLRRLLFFSGGHRRLMQDVIGNIGALLPG